MTNSHAATVRRFPCSGCGEPLALNVATLVVTMRVPSNGKRGSLHVPAHDVTAEAVEVGPLIEWDCPLCGYADSEEVEVDD